MCFKKHLEPLCCMPLSCFCFGRSSKDKNDSRPSKDINPQRPSKIKFPASRGPKSLEEQFFGYDKLLAEICLVKYLLSLSEWELCISICQSLKQNIVKNYLNSYSGIYLCKVITISKTLDQFLECSQKMTGQNSFFPSPEISMRKESKLQIG